MRRFWFFLYGVLLRWLLRGAVVVRDGVPEIKPALKQVLDRRLETLGLLFESIIIGFIESRARTTIRAYHWRKERGFRRRMLWNGQEHRPKRQHCVGVTRRIYED